MKLCKKTRVPIHTELKLRNVCCLINPFMHELILKIDPILDDLEKIAVTQRITQLETPEISPFDREFQARLFDFLIYGALGPTVRALWPVKVRKISKCAKVPI